MLLQAGCNLGSRSWLHWAGLPSDGCWLAKADGKTRRAAVLELLPLLRCTNMWDPEPDLAVAHARADVVVGMCSLLQRQLSMPGAMETLPAVYPLPTCYHLRPSAIAPTLRRSGTDLQ